MTNIEAILIISTFAIAMLFIMVSLNAKYNDYEDDGITKLGITAIFGIVIATIGILAFQ